MSFKRELFSLLQEISLKCSLFSFRVTVQTRSLFITAQCEGFLPQSRKDGPFHSHFLGQQHNLYYTSTSAVGLFTYSFLPYKLQQISAQLYLHMCFLLLQTRCWNRAWFNFSNSPSSLSQLNCVSNFPLLINSLTFCPTVNCPLPHSFCLL